MHAVKLFRIVIGLPTHRCKYSSRIK